MSELFDMVSGTSTGSLLTTAVVMPDANGQPKYYADNGSIIYQQHGSDVFMTFELPLWIQCLSTAGAILVGGLIGYFVGVCIWQNKEHEKTMASFHEFIQKRKGKKNEQDSQTKDSGNQGFKFGAIANALQKSITTKIENMLEKEGFKLSKQFTQQMESGDLKDLKNAEEKLFRWDMKYREKKGRKWITMLAGMFVFGIVCWFLVPYTVKLQHSLYNREGIQNVTTIYFGDTRISDVLTDDLMIVAYDFRNFVPVFFTKYAAQQNLTGVMNPFIRDAAQASSAAPIYFDPKSIDGISDALIDGGVIANSPAFYSYLHVKYVSKKSNNIRLVSIGTGEQQPDKLTSDSVNKVTWVSELGASSQQLNKTLTTSSARSSSVPTTLDSRL